MRHRLFTLVILLFLLHPIAALAVCADPCEPNPDDPSYGGTLLARPQPYNARQVVTGTNPRAATASVASDLVGSESYSYAVPILSLPGRNGLDLNLTLYYNSRIWTIDKTNATATFNADRDWPSYGFRLGFGYIERSSSTVFIMTEADGTKRQLNYVTTNVYQSNDATYIEYNSSTKILRYKNGTKVLYQSFSSKPNKFWRPIKITDTNGNYISIAYVADKDQLIATIIDTLGRVVTFNYDPNFLLSSISTGERIYAAFTWNTAYSLNYNFGPSPFVAANSPASGTTLNVLTGCRYANNTGYNFIYGDWGIIRRIENANSAENVRSSIEFDFPDTTTQLNDHPTYQHQTVYDGDNTTTSTIQVTKVSGRVQTYEVTDPSGTKTKSTMDSSGLLSSVEVSDGTNTLRLTSYTWDTGPLPSSITTTLSDSSQQSRVVYTYGPYGNVSTFSGYDFGLQLKRTTAYTYLNSSAYTSRHIFDRVTQILVKDAAGVVQARTDFAYDGTTISGASPPALNHDDTNYPASFTYRGNVSTITRYATASPPSGAIARNFSYDLFGNLIAADLDCCNQKHWTYAKATEYAYPETITRGPSGLQLQTSATYNVPTGTVASTTDENNQTTNYAYDEMDRLQTVTRQFDNVSTTTLYHDDTLLPSTETSSTANSAKQVVTTTGLGAVKFAQLKNDATLLSTVETQYFPVTRTVQTSNPYGPNDSPQWTVTIADRLGRPLSVTPPGGGGGTTYSYYGSSVTITDPAGKQRRNYSDALGRLVQVDEPGWGDAFPGAGSVVISGSEQSSQYCEWDPDLRRQICDPPEYDSGTVSITVNGSTKTVSYAQGSTASSVAVALSSAISSDAGYPAFASASGSTVLLTSKLAGAQTNYSLSTSVTHSFPQPSFSATPSGTNLAGGEDEVLVDNPSLSRPLTTTYQYDVLDNLTLVTQGVMDTVQGQTLPTQQRSYVYDSLGRLTRATTPESGQVQYTYDSFSNVATRADARGIVSTYSYDLLNRLSGVSYNDGLTPPVTLAYESGNGRLHSVSSAALGQAPATSETYTYDPIGRITGVAKTVGSKSFSVSYGYNNADQLNAITYPQPTARLVQHDYDPVGRLSKVKSGTTDYVSNLAYTAAGQVTQFSYGNSVQADFTYNNRLQLASLRYSKDSTDLLNLAYNYGTQNNGQIASIQYFNGATEDLSRSVNYTYDAWSRLRTAATSVLDTAGTRDAGTWNVQWDYDRFGNRSTQHFISGVNPGWVNDVQLSINPLTNRITDTGYSYDDAGNMTADGQHAYTYDAENRITKLDYDPESETSVAQYLYDANGLRVRKSFGAIDTYYVFSGTKVIAEYDVGLVNNVETTTAIREYVYSGSQLVADLASDGSGAGTVATYHHPDHLSVRVNTDDQGNNIGQQAHYPFGDSWYSFDTSTKWGFTTYERDSESGNDYAMFRYHVNRLGRFSSPDPLGGNIGNPQSLNRYAYTTNDPANALDALGLDDCLASPADPHDQMCQGGFSDFLSFMAGGGQVLLDTMLVSGSMGDAALGTGAGVEGSVPFGERLELGYDQVLGSIYMSSDVIPVYITGADLPGATVYFGAFLAKQTGPPGGQPSSGPKPIYCEDAVVAQMGDAWKNTGNGTHNNKKEEAGFRVDLINGQTSVGPIIISSDELHLSIPINPNTIATFHSHPLGGLEVPSTTGSHPDTANRLPTYIFSNRGLYVTDPTAPQGYRGPLRKGYPWNKCK